MRSSWGAQPGEKKVHGGPSCSLQLLDRRGQPGGSCALLPGNKGWHERKSPQPFPGQSRLGIRENVFTERTVQPWQRLPREVESPSLEGFKSSVDLALGDMD